MEKYGFVYIWRDRKHNRYYIGCHWGREDDGYICSSKWMKQAFYKRPEDFKRRILTRTNIKENIFKEEQKWLNLIKNEELKSRYYNLTNICGHWASDPYYALSVKERISKRTKEAMALPENRRKYEEGLKKRPKTQSEETKKKRSESMKKTPEKKYPLEERKYRPSRDSQEHSENMRRNTAELWNRPGYKEEVGKKISEGLKCKQNRLGQKNSEEHRRKISEARKGKRMSYRIIVEGSEYNSLEEISKDWSVSVPTIYRRLRSDNYPSWNKIDA